MKKIADFFRHMSFSLKITLTVLLAVVPMVAVTFLSLHELSHATEQQHLRLIQNNYTQVKTNIEEKLTAIHNASTLIAVSDQVNDALMAADQADIRSQLSAFEQVSDYARTVEMGNSQMSIFFFLQDEYLVVQDRSTRYRPLSSLQASSLLMKLGSSQGRPVWGIVTDSIARGQTSLALARDIIDQNDYTKALGILLIALDKAQVEPMLLNALGGQYLGLCTQDGTLYADNGQALPEGFAFDLSEGESGFHRQVWANKPYLVNASQLGDTGLYLASLLPEALVTQEVRSAQYDVSIAYALIFLAMGVMLIPATGWLVKGIRQLRRQLLDVPKHGLRKLTSGSQHDEIGQLVAAYNNMVDEMERMLTIQYDMGRAKVGAELKALQSQINPHFLYNTLDMVSWMAKRQETDNIQQVMQALSQFYKLTLSGGRDVITLDEELKLCAAFMSIQQLRWAGAIDYMAEVDDDLLSACIPKITLQPLIENAIKHGIMQRGEARGSIIVSAVGETIDGHERMTLSVLDNGVGMADSKQEMDKGSGSHYGMKNIEMRLSLFYGEDIHIQVDSELGLGTCVSLTLPVISHKEETK